MIQLSKRMQAVANLTSAGCTVCDVGCDHAYLPIYLVQTKKFKRAIAMDVGTGPLAIAEANILEQGLSHQIETRLSDGLEKLEYLEANCLIIAGMGGALIIRILQTRLDVAKIIPEIILQPQSEIDEVRRFLYAQGFHIFAEDMVCEEEKYYPMMRVSFVGNEEHLTEAEVLYGPHLIATKHPVLMDYLGRQEQVYGQILAQLETELTNQADEIKRAKLTERESEIKHLRTLVQATKEQMSN